jgi:hypothetical protein
MDPRLRGDDGQLRISVVTPAKAGAHRNSSKSFVAPVEATNIYSLSASAA